MAGKTEITPLTDAEDGDCMCEFPNTCGGTGVLYCDGCGGDQCVCTCGGEGECIGCEECEGTDDDED